MRIVGVTVTPHSNSIVPTLRFSVDLSYARWREALVGVSGHLEVLNGPVVARLVDGQVRVRVRDTGIGIPLERQKTLFERYGASEGGSGLGMWLVKKLVELHQGTIAVHSRPGERTTIDLVMTGSEAPAR